MKLRPGVWALVLFHDAAAVPTGPVEIVFDEEDAQAVAGVSRRRPRAPPLRHHPLVLAFALALGEAGRIYLITGNIWTTWGVVPLGTVFLFFPASFTVTMLWHMFKNMRCCAARSRAHADFANRPLEVEATTWPSVTIQIPIFREPFDDAIRPTLDAAREAAGRYREKTGARCNVLVCDDGLLYFAANDLEGALEDARSTPPARAAPHKPSCSRASPTTRPPMWRSWHAHGPSRACRAPSGPGASARPAT